MSSNAQTKKDENLAVFSGRSQYRSDRSLLYCCRAKYYVYADGERRLASLERFSLPRFRPSGWEPIRDGEREQMFVPPEEVSEAEGGEPSEENIARARRRAQQNMADLVFCNVEKLDVFITLTISPDVVSEKGSWEETYPCVKNWLSNKVQRRGGAYVGVAERTKIGDVHWHFLMNSGALDLVGATNAHTGAALYHNHRRVYNEASWRYGFSTAQRVSGDDAETRVRKYLMKYCTKGAEKVGGRYYLHGGLLAHPVYEYADDLKELGDARNALWQTSVDVGDGLTFERFSFI